MFTPQTEIVTAELKDSKEEIAKQCLIALQKERHPEERGDIEFRQFIDNVSAKLIERVTTQPTGGEDKVGTHLTPPELREVFDFSIPTGGGEKLANLEVAIDNILEHAVRTDHPMFFNQLYAATNPVGVVGDWLTAVINCTMYTFEIAGPFMLMEETVMQQMRSTIGYPGGNGDGIMCPGGSACNQQAVALARYVKFPETKTKGLFGMKRLGIFTSAECHYSIDKSAFHCGFGTESVIKVKCDSEGRMLMDELEKEILKFKEDGGEPLMVNCTAGTTVRGMFDSINGCADICEKNNMWFHVDGAWGGAAAFSSRYQQYCSGLNRADSITIDAHKMLGTTQQCAFLLTKPAAEDNFLKCNSACAKYLFQMDKPYAQYDTGDKYTQCGRRNDILKFWLAWKSIGIQGLELRVNTAFDLAVRFHEMLNERRNSGFVALQAPEAPNVCFFYIPQELQSDPIAKKMMATTDAKDVAPLLRSDEAKDFAAKLHEVGPRINQKFSDSGVLMCGFQSIIGLPNFWRMVFMNPRVTEEHLNIFLDAVESHSV